MHPDQFNKLNAFKLNWQNNPTQSANHTDGFYAMRNWQIPAFELLNNAPYMILNAPMGSGKSWMMCLLSAFKMQENQSLRTIIAVPQTIIAPGFITAKIMMPNDTKLHWQIKHNLCDSQKQNRRTVEYLINWLQNSPTSLNDRTIICTHATLVALHRKLRSIHRLDLLNNLLIWIDEAHHVKNVAIESLNGAVLNNGLGELATHILTSSECNAELGLTTASFFRGDRCSLLTPDMEAKFKRFNLPFDEYFKSMKHLKSFSFDFLLCGSDYFKAIELILKQYRGKDIIYIPHPISQHSTGNKYKEVDTIISIYRSVHGGNDKENKLKILDLVNETGRIEKKEFLNSGNLKENRDALDAIITLGMFKEGANWIWANRSIIVGARSSLQDMIQMIGRLFRDAEGKEHVEVIQLLPFALDQQDTEKFEENLNDYLKAILASLILENILNPVVIKTKKSQLPSKDNDLNAELTESNRNWLSLAIPDEAKQEIIVQDVCHNLFGCTSRDERETVAQRVLENHGIIEYKEEVANQILNMFSRRSINMEGISSKDIDIDLIYKTDPLDFLLRYTSRACNIDTFQKLRDAIQMSRRQWRPFQDAKEFVWQLALLSETEWESYTAGKMPQLPLLPHDIPKAPWAAYKEWINLGDFLGTNQIAPRLRKYRPLESARAFAHTLKLHGRDDWNSYTQGKRPDLPPLPDDIPASPSKTYKRAEYGNKWISWNDFLGTGRISNHDKSKNWRPYNEAAGLTQSFKLKNAKDWLRYINGEFKHLPPLPNDIPRKPDEAYSEWIDWPNFLGSGISKFNCNRGFWSFNDARDFAHSLKLSKQTEWNDYCAGRLLHLPPKPMGIPSNPSKKYKNKGWVNLKDWLGTK
jgi:hypothetical protein